MIAGFAVNLSVAAQPRPACHTPWQHWRMRQRNRIRRALLRLADAVTHTPLSWEHTITAYDGSPVATVRFTEDRTGHPRLSTDYDDGRYAVEAVLG